jgi:hypothetical protein
MNEKTTVYIEPELKRNVRVTLLKEYDNKSLSVLINELLTKWIIEQEKKE